MDESASIDDCEVDEMTEGNDQPSSEFSPLKRVHDSALRRNNKIKAMNPNSMYSLVSSSYFDQ